MSEPILFEISEGVGLLTLNRPDQRNAMNAALCDAFVQTVDRICDEPSVRAVVITGAGRSFCSGADFTTLGDLAGRSGAPGPMAMHQAIHRFYDAFRCVNRIPVPTIAAVNGAAVGGGLGLALHCDIRILSETAKIGANFARLGIHPGMGITALLPRLMGYEAAAELLFSGELIRGAEAASLGMARKAVPKEEVLPEAMAMARRFATSAPLAIPLIKKTLRLASAQRLDEVLEMEAYAQVLLGQTEDASEGVQAMLSRRDPEFTGK